MPGAAAETSEHATFLDERTAAAILGLSVRTLQRWRVEGGGPSFYRFGKRRLYKRDDLLAWAEPQKSGSTSEAKPVDRGPQGPAAGSAIAPAAQKRRGRISTLRRPRKKTA